MTKIHITYVINSSDFHIVHMFDFGNVLSLCFDFDLESHKLDLVLHNFYIRVFKNEKSDLSCHNLDFKSHNNDLI